MSIVTYCSACGRLLPHPAPVTCSSCGAAHWNDAKPSASALVVHDGMLLMTRRGRAPWKGAWDVPGGFCGTAEHPITTARRETLEETGYTVRITGFLGIWLDHYQAPEDLGRSKRTLNIYYHAVLISGPMARRDPSEVEAVAWFSPDQLPESLAFPGHTPQVLNAWREAVASGCTQSALPDRPD